MEALALLSRHARCDAVLLSGGVDSTAVALAAVEAGLRPLAVTVSLRGCRRDVAYAAEVAAALGLPHRLVLLGPGEAMGYVERAVALLGTYDPMEAVNCAVQLAGMEAAAEAGASRVCTGDAGDELFVGYSYMSRMPADQLEAYRRELPRRWRFCSFRLARALGMEAVAPFTAEDVVSYALSLPADAVRGKAPLRRELARRLPRVAERRKEPMEEGSCFRTLYSQLEGLGGKTYLKAVFEALGHSYPRSPGGCPECGYAGYDGRYCPICGHHPRRT